MGTCGIGVWGTRENIVERGGDIGDCTTGSGIGIHLAQFTKCVVTNNINCLIKPLTILLSKSTLCNKRSCYSIIT